MELLRYETNRNSGKDIIESGKSQYVEAWDGAYLRINRPPSKKERRAMRMCKSAR